MDYPNDQYHAYKYFGPRWRKTQVIFFASCVKSENIKNEASEKGNVILKGKRVSSNESQTPGNFSNVFENSSRPERSSRSSSFDQNDDAFLPKQRRSSDPVKRDGDLLLSRFGRRKSNKLRSLSEGGTTQESLEQRKVRFASSSDSIVSYTSHPIPIKFTFSPQVVRKINLRASLQDWIENEKQLRGFCKPKANSRTKGSGVSKENKKQLGKGRSKSLSPEPTVWEEIDCNNNTASARHIYRRLSADSVLKNSQAQNCSPSFPRPDFTGSRGLIENAFYPKKAVSAQTVTTLLNIRRPALVTCPNTDVKYDNVQDFLIQCVMKEELRSRLSHMSFCPENSRKWCEEISEVIKARVQLWSTSPCKVVCTIYIGALRDFGIHSATQALLDYKMDHHASVCYQNKSLFAMASVFAVRYSCK